MITQKQLAEFRHEVDVMNARLKRAGQKPYSYHGVSCGCGCGPFISKFLDTELQPPTPPQPKHPTKRKPKQQHYMFNGNVV